MSARPVVLCAGSLHHDVIVEAPALPRIDQTLTGTAVRYVFGGKGGNQAAAAARAGAEAHMAAAVGSDDLAMTLRQALDDAGVRRSSVQTHPGPSGMSVAISVPGGEYGAVIVSGANLLLRAEAVQFPRDCAILLLQSEIAEAANLSLARRAREAGVRVILNAAPARPVLPDLLRLTDVLVVNHALLLSDLKPAKRLYLLGTGTGLAPFLSIAKDPEVYDRFEKIVLVHGVRQVSELAYGDYLTRELPQNDFFGELVREKFVYYPTVTREPFRTMGRMTDLIESGKLTSDLGLPPLHPAEDRVMICGSPSMLADLRTILDARGFVASPHMGVPGDYVFERAFVEK